MESAVWFCQILIFNSLFFLHKAQKCSPMRPRIALATVSGRAYYKLVNELERKGLPFLSLRPWDPVPLGIKVVVTTNEERHLIEHPSVLVLENGSNSAAVIDMALLRIRGKQNYEKVVVGVDPGKTYGVAILGDDDARARALPGETVIEIVSEAGTSRFVKETTHRRGLRDAMSAVEIVGRKGRPFSRGKAR